MKNNTISLRSVVGGGYDDFWGDKHRYRVLKGGKGSKKSTTTALNMIFRIMNLPESNLLVVRAVMNTHRDSTFAQLEWAQERLGVKKLWNNKQNPLEMIYKPTGQKIIFRGMDDVLKLASTTVPRGYLNFVWVEESFEIQSEEDFNKLDQSVARGKLPPHLFNQITLTFNPWSETHWLKKRFFDRQDVLTSTYSTNYLCNEHLTPEYHTIMEQLKERNYRRYAVAGLGEWGIAEGLIFENWESRVFDKDKLGAEDKTEWQYKHFFGLDYGYTNDPTAFIAFAANPVSKELYIYDEHYETKMLNSDIARMITQKGFAKERIRADAAEPKSNEDLRRMGIGRIQGAVKGKDSVINGITALQEYKIYVHPRCENTIKELSSYCWRKDKNENGLNEPEDKNNHLMDALRYAFQDVRFWRPEDPKIRHRLTPDERYNRQHSVSAEDMRGGWE